MQKMLLFSLFLCAFGTAVASTPPSPKPSTADLSELFRDDLTRFDHDLCGLSELEALVEQRGATYADLAAERHEWIHYALPNDDLSQSLLGHLSPENERLLGIPGFLWGCCFGVVGAVLVYVAIDDPVARQREGKQALIGCAVSMLLVAALYFAAIVSSLSY
jgi:hypothetical protein